MEIMQFVLARGWFELADIVLNMFGAVLGFALWMLMHAHRTRLTQSTLFRP